MRPFACRYTLHDGTRGMLYMLAACSCDVVVAALDALGDQLHTCRVSPRLSSSSNGGRA